ncbi:MAG: dihydroneopterin aldolase [Syntrophomonadaceae bacterium]
MDSIIARGLTFRAYHGLYEQERQQGQDFRVDLEMFADLAGAGQSDRIEDTIDYARVFRLVEEIVTATRFNLIEALAENIAHSLLASFPRLKAIEVMVYKPEAPVQGEFEYFAVKIFRSQE